MPAPSDSVRRLAEDLVRVGRLYGFQAEKEFPVREGSQMRVDVFWKIKMPPTSPFPDVNVASIEIQCSDSPSSISHNILKAEKTLHPSYHVVISYSKLTKDFIENTLRTNYPQKGLIIIHGEEQIRGLNFWITRFTTLKKLERKLADEGKRMRDYAVSQLGNMHRLEIERNIKENFGPEIEEVFTTASAIDRHAMMLNNQLKQFYSRFFGLREKWTDGAKRGLLPDPSRIGAFDVIKSMLDNSERKLSVLISHSAKKTETPPVPVVGFEYVIDLRDDLHDINKTLGIVERGYWQRLERHDILHNNEPEIDNRKPEYELNRHAIDAADIVCTSYWDSIFADPHNCPWRGLSVYGEYLEFRLGWNCFFFVPSYSRISFTRSWMLLSHMIAHQAARRLFADNRFAKIHQDLTSIFAQIPSLLLTSTTEYLADETIADILATLISGEQYILSLTDLEYYPSLTLSSSKFRVASVRYPMILRTLVCIFTVRLAWGFEDTMDTSLAGIPDNQILSRTLDNVRKEDLLAGQIFLNFLEKKPEELSRLAGEKYTSNEVYSFLENSWDHLHLLNYIAPTVIDQILKKNIITRLKKLVKRDFYLSEPSSRYYNVDKNRCWSRMDLLSLARECFIESPEATGIKGLRKNRNKCLRRILADLKECRSADGEPRDILAALSSLVYGTGRTDEKWNHTALYSILSRRREGSSR
jgi:hypothetical protein